MGGGGLPTMPSQACRINGVAESAKARPTGEDAVRKIHFTLHAEKHWRNTREAQRGSHKASNCWSANPKGAATCSCAQAVQGPVRAGLNDPVWCGARRSYARCRPTD